MIVAKYKLFIYLMAINLAFTEFLSRSRCPSVEKKFRNRPVCRNFRSWELKPVAFLYSSPKIMNIFIDFFGPIECRTMYFFCRVEGSLFGDIYFGLIDDFSYCFFASIIKKKDAWISKIDVPMSGTGYCTTVLSCEGMYIHFVEGKWIILWNCREIPEQGQIEVSCFIRYTFKICVTRCISR